MTPTATTNLPEFMWKYEQKKVRSVNNHMAEQSPPAERCFVTEVWISHVDVDAISCFRFMLDPPPLWRITVLRPFLKERWRFREVLTKLYLIEAVVYGAVDYAYWFFFYLKPSQIIDGVDTILETHNIYTQRHYQIKRQANTDVSLGACYNQTTNILACFVTLKENAGQVH